MSTLTAAPAVPERTTQAVAAAARSLVAARDGLMATLLHLAEETACETEDRAVEVITLVLGALPVDEQQRRAGDMAVLAHDTWGTFDPYLTPDRDAAHDRLITAARVAAERVIHVLRVDACLCREVRS